VTTALGAQQGMELVDLATVSPPPEVIEKVSVTMANMYRIFPVKFEENTLTVAMADVRNVNALDDLRFMLNCEVVGAIADEQAIAQAISKYYGDKTESIEDLMKDLEEAGLTEDATAQFETQSTKSIDIGDLTQMATEVPVVKLMNLYLLQAIKAQASDIHFEPFEDDFKVRYRIDGALYEMMPPPRHLAQALIARVKVMANMDISERRLPQDNRIELSISGNPIDLRVSTLPTKFGESVVLRILDRRVVALDLNQVGLREDDLDVFRALMQKPNGIILVTGPTGSGKTTTLYAALSEMNQVDTKIITAEDPVEYDIEGLVQVQVRPEAGTTFASLLRAILRQDPDVILVGEIRDLETAQIAIQASLTGHMVFSTLHTNDAPQTVTRLIDMGVEPFLASATLEAILAQRLVRRICKGCKEEYAPSDEILMEINLNPETLAGKKFWTGRGCETCNNTGYKGRTAIHEILVVDDRIRELINENAPTSKLRDVARERGMRTLRDSGLLTIYDGTTTIEEVASATLFAE
ncbi:MAG: type II/IV secretion system protein, partial [Planctomycetes bacterium]|nr:type II/IV secretion system protein [Planctomycetota bacterium]